MTAESGHGASWVEVTYAGATYDVKIEATAGTYAAGLRWGVSTDDGEPGIVALFDGDTANYSKGVAEPRSVGVSSAGQVVIADWIEYGTSTESRVAVLDTAGEIRYADELDHGAVLVDISDDGTHIAVSTYESAVRVYNVETGELVGLHRCSVVARPVVEFVTENSATHILVREAASGDRLYSITLDGAVVDESEAVKVRRYVGSFEPDGAADWVEAAEELRTAYVDAGSDELRDYVIEVVSDNGLRNVSTGQALDQIIVQLEAWYQACHTPDHSRAVAIRLADAYYRYAKAAKTSVGGAAFWDRVETAQNYAEEGLPWYEAKAQLAKSHRIQSRTHERRNEPREATQHLERIRDLEEEYDVALLNKADKDRLRDS
jgi:hypothetical protein